MFLERVFTPSPMLATPTVLELRVEIPRPTL